MNARIIHKHITRWQAPISDRISRYNGRLRNCKRWRNRRKAQKMWTLSIQRKIRAIKWPY